MKFQEFRKNFTRWASMRVYQSSSKSLRRQKYAKRSTKDSSSLSSGAVMGFISCVLSMTNPFPSLLFILYGFTSASVLVICYGLYLVFE
ncbi:MAG: hypothetical protein IPP51_18050 [Bacteroidetes bacterium]|nr:hypothetical protein [Bacteroidota bacterium]